MGNQAGTGWKTHPHVTTIQTYLKGCNTGDIALILSTFDPDVVHYFCGHDPVRGADTLAKFFIDFNAGVSRTEWTIDHAVVDGDEVVIEYTSVTAYKDGRPRGMQHGSEWYVFRDGKICEIRVYSLSITGKPINQLNGFPYAERGYLVVGPR